jgi:peptidoglycan biosynthesis protein MviN/MurJ (putative lipid II flippase)
LIGAATLCSRILGFIRDIILANLFGANAAADAFYIAYRIPNLLRELFAEGSMSSAFIPVFTEYHSTRSKQETWELASAAFTTLLTLVTIVSLLGILAAPGLVWMLAPGLHDDLAQLATTTLLTQIMFPYLLLAALAMGILNALRSFAIPAFAPVFFNMCVIVFALAISPMFDQPIVAVAIGIVVGGLAQFLMQLPGLHKKGFLLSWNFHPTHPGVKRMGVLLIPTLLGLAVTQINLTISTILASYFEGGPTYLFYAMRLIQFPLGIFGVAMATAILPSLSTHAAKGAFGSRYNWDCFSIVGVLRGAVGLCQLQDFSHGLLFSAGHADPSDCGDYLRRDQYRIILMAHDSTSTCWISPGRGVSRNRPHLHLGDHFRKTPSGFIVENTGSLACSNGNRTASGDRNLHMDWLVCFMAGSRSESSKNGLAVTGHWGKCDRVFWHPSNSALRRTHACETHAPTKIAKEISPI